MPDDVGVGGWIYRGVDYVAAVDDPARFKSSKQVGPHFGLTPKRYQSGETDYNEWISKIGDASVRTAHYEAANAIQTKPLKGADRWNEIRRQSKTSQACRGITEDETKAFGRGATPAARSEVPSPGRWKRSNRAHPRDGNNRA